MKLGNLKKDAASFLNQYKNENPATYAAAQQAIGGLLIVDGFIGIENPFGGKKRAGIFGSLMGIFMGVIFLFIPSFFGNLTGTNKMTATTNATVVSTSQHQSSGSNGGTTCSATAKYTVNGQEYTQASSISSSSMCSLASGQTAEIYYNPDNPGQWSTDVKTIDMILKFFFVAGIVAIVVSLFTFIVRLLSIIFGWKLLKSGRALAGTLPEGTDVTTVMKEIEQNFKTSLFGFSTGKATAPQPMPMQAPEGQQAAPVQQDTSPQPVNPPSQVVRPSQTQDPSAPHTTDHTSQ